MPYTRFASPSLVVLFLSILGLAVLCLAGPLVSARPATAQMPDIRRLEVDARNYPWSPIGRLNAGGRGHCTGFLIGERTLLTAAHCLYDGISGRWRAPGELHFIAAYQREDYRLNAKVIQYEVSEHFDPVGGAGPENTAADWAVVTLQKPLGLRTGWYGLRPLNEALLAREKAGKALLLQAGYQRGRSHVLTIASLCKIAGAFAKGAAVAHDCVVGKGDSGSPLLVLDNGRIAAVGLHVIQARWKGRPLAGVLSLAAFYPGLSEPAGQPLARALADAWGPGQRPARDSGIGQAPDRTIDRQLIRLGYLKELAATETLSAERTEAIKNFKINQDIGATDIPPLLLLEHLLRAEN